MFNAPPSNLAAPAWNLHIIKDKQADQPVKKWTPYDIQVLPLLNFRGWTTAHFQKCMYSTCQMFCTLL
jgi:hypothetical protein